MGWGQKENPGISARVFVVWQGLTSSFKTDMDIMGQWLDLYYLGEAFEA